MARRTSRVRFTRPAPKTKIWIGAGVGDVTIVASANAIVSSLSAGALLLRPFTILRTRMLINYESDQAAVSERGFGSLGRIVVSSQAVAAGATAIPDPGTISGDPDADWFVHQPCMFSFLFLDSSGFTDMGSLPYVIDSKAMRKVGPNQDVVTMFSEEGAKGAVLTTQGRMLVQLH